MFRVKLIFFFTTYQSYSKQTVSSVRYFGINNKQIILKNIAV